MGGGRREERISGCMRANAHRVVSLDLGANGRAGVQMWVQHEVKIPRDNIFITKYYKGQYHL